jgi:hypothetical protein
MLSYKRRRRRMSLPFPYIFIGYNNKIDMIFDLFGEFGN